MDRRMRKRMVMLKSEQDRALKAQLTTSICSMKSFDESKDERESALENGQNSFFDERDSTCGSHVTADCISEMRRRRIHQMANQRPYPTKLTKKKHNFSFSEADNQDSSKQTTARVLWDVDTNKHQNEDSFSKDEIMDGLDYEEDEIMTPVKIKRLSSVYDNMTSAEGGFSPTVDEATITEISAATKALSAFVTSAAVVMKEAKTPEKEDKTSHWAQPENLETSTSEDNIETLSSVHDAFKLFKDTAMAMASTPATKLITTIPTPLTTKTLESVTDEPEELMVTKIGLVDNKRDTNDAEKPNPGGLWASLFIDTEGFSGAVDANNKAMLEALVEGGALQREIDDKNVLKLFIDMYQKDTFEKIVYAIQELKGLQGLVICRGVDKSRPTYRTNDEIASLFGATKQIQQLDSLTLLNFNSDSLTDLAMMIHQQPLLYRLQIQLADGTLNGEILGVIATAPRLTHLSLDFKESCSLGTLMNSKTLESVRINSRDLQLKQSHVRTLIYGLQTNFNLTTLDLGPAISVEQFQSLCIALKQNFRLESLRINMELKTEEDSRIVSLELASLFKENNFLLNVWNYSYQSCAISEANKHCVFSSLRSNKTMQEFRFFSEDIGDWKNTTDGVGNPTWFKRNLSTPATEASTACGGKKDYDESVSFLTNASEFEPESTSFLDNPVPFCGVDCSTMSPPECMSVKQLRAKFQNWANSSTSNNVRTMEV